MMINYYIYSLGSTSNAFLNVAPATTSLTPVTFNKWDPIWIAGLSAMGLLIFVNLLINIASMFLSKESTWYYKFATPHSLWEDNVFCRMSLLTSGCILAGIILIMLEQKNAKTVLLSGIAGCFALQVLNFSMGFYRRARNDEQEAKENSRSKSKLAVSSILNLSIMVGTVMWLNFMDTNDRDQIIKDAESYALANDNNYLNLTKSFISQSMVNSANAASQMISNALVTPQIDSYASQIANIFDNLQYNKISVTSNPIGQDKVSPSTNNVYGSQNPAVTLSSLGLTVQGLFAKNDSSLSKPKNSMSCIYKDPTKNATILFDNVNDITFDVTQKAITSVAYTNLVLTANTAVTRTLFNTNKYINTTFTDQTNNYALFAYQQQLNSRNIESVCVMNEAFILMIYGDGSSLLINNNGTLYSPKTLSSVYNVTTIPYEIGISIDYSSSGGNSTYTYMDCSSILKTYNSQTMTLDSNYVVKTEIDSFNNIRVSMCNVNLATTDDLYMPFFVVFDDTGKIIDLGYGGNTNGCVISMVN